MRIEGQNSLALLHNLAILYLGLAQGADEDLDPAETKEVAARLRRWQPGKDPAVIDHVIRDIALSYREDTDEQHIIEAAQTLGNSLSESVRKAILDDLNQIARADGRVLDVERDFIRDVADIWQLKPEADPEQPMA